MVIAKSTLLAASGLFSAFASLLAIGACRTNPDPASGVLDTNATTPDPPRAAAGQRYGSPVDVQPLGNGPALVAQGGGPEVEAAFRWMANLSGAGDLVILTAASETSAEKIAEGGALTDGLDGWAKGLGFNSVQMFRLPSFDASFNTWTPNEHVIYQQALAAVAKAEVIYFGGGNQHDYTVWPEELLAAVRKVHSERHGILSGSSAGMAIQGGTVFDFVAADAAGGDSVETDYAAIAPGVNGPSLSFSPGRLHVAFMRSILTDTHFHQRDRLGRLVAFMTKTGVEHALACDETTAVAMAAGRATLIRDGDVGACFFLTKGAMGTSANGAVKSTVSVVRLDVPGQQFDLASWSSCTPGVGPSYKVTVDGSLAGTKPNADDSVAGAAGLHVAIYTPANPYTFNSPTGVPAN